MALARGYANMNYRWQGLSLHCWRTSLEMLMDWRYGCIYGVDADGADRTDHTPQVRAASHYGHHGGYLPTAANRGMARRELGEVSRSYGYSPGNVRDYGLRQVSILSEDIDGSVARLKAGGPILANGKYGPARVGGGHVVLVIGVSGSNKVVYLDPFVGGVQRLISAVSCVPGPGFGSNIWAAFTNHYSYLSAADFFERLFASFGMQELVQASPFTGTAESKGWRERN